MSYDPKTFEKLCCTGIPDYSIFALLEPNKCKKAAEYVVRRWVKEHYGLTYALARDKIREEKGAYAS